MSAATFPTIIRNTYRYKQRRNFDKLRGVSGARAAQQQMQCFSGP